MSTRKLAIAAGLVLAFGAVALAESPKLGKPISPKDFTSIGKKNCQIFGPATR